MTGNGPEGHGTMIAVLIATDVRIYRDGLVLALREHPIVTVVGTAASAVEVLDSIVARSAGAAADRADLSDPGPRKERTR